MSTYPAAPVPTAAHGTGRSVSSSSSSRRMNSSNNLPPHLVTNTPPTPSRSPSNASTGGDVSGAGRELTGPEDREEEEEDGDSADESDFHAEGDPDDPEASSVALSRLGPALATPKQTSTTSPWPFTAATSSSAEGMTTRMTKPALDVGAGSDASPTSQHAAPGGGLPANAHQGSTVSGPSSTPAAASATSDAAMLLSPTSSAAAIPASSLPHEILLHILRLLPPSSLAPALRVCKAWCQCGVELLWYKPTFTSLPSLYKMLQVLSHPDQTFPYPDFVRRLNFLPLAKEMSDRLVAKILPCTRLERITLTNCKALSSPAIAALLIRSHRLVALDLTDVESVDDQVLIALAENCPRLQGLNLSGCTRVTDRGVEALALKATGMRRIKLRKCEQLTDVPIMLLSIHCPLLLEIDLAFCTSVSQHAVMQLFRTSTCLREVSLPGCAALTDEGFPDANELQIVSSLDAIQNGGGSYPQSGYASPSYAYHLNGSGAEGGGGGGSAASSAPGTPGSGTEPLVSTSGYSLPRPRPIRSPPAYKPFDQLRYIDVTSCAGLTDAAVAGIAKYCPKLRNLMLGKCIRLTDDALLAICGIGKHLHYLHLGHVHNITDRAVTAIARACTRLRYIDLANCTNLTDQSVIELANNLPRLKRIGLVRVNNITDAAIEALSQRTSLERIHLSYCDNLTVAAISSMLQELPRVTHLSLTGVTSFRKRLLQHFCRAPPSNFNDHQRRSFCVFSGRGVVDLRKFLRNLSSAELNALAIPDPPSDDETPGNFARNTHAMMAAAAAAAGNPANAGLVRANGMQQVPVGQTAAQFAATQARLAQIQQARQTLAIAHQRLQAHQAAAARQQLPQQGAAATTTAAPTVNGSAPNPYAIQAGLAGNNMLGLDLPAGGQQGSSSTAATWGGASDAAGSSRGARALPEGAARMPHNSARRVGQLSSGHTSSQSSEDDSFGDGTVTPANPALLPSTFAAAAPPTNGSAPYHNSAPAAYAALWSSPAAGPSTSLVTPNQQAQQQRQQESQQESNRSSPSLSRSRSPALPEMDLDGRDIEQDGPDASAPWRNRRRSTITRQSYLADHGQAARPEFATVEQALRGDSDSDDGEGEGEEEDISMEDA
ncbi:hypothetical protein JCM10908_002750 [Rhodotorula pacifica]|uniref:uncharacterized protein n=1 Tax=Rhodotorula pacifica TaxID=1495444 RepID=UPI00316FD3CE